MQLRIPGPTPIPAEIQKVLSRQMINHRGPEFAEMIRKMTAILKEIFQTKGDVLILTGSGPRVLESAPWVAFAPITTLFVTVLALNFAGDRIREFTDVRDVSL